MRKLTGSDKAAVLLLAMGEELAATILAQMPRGEAARVASALSRLGRVDEATAAAVLIEFSQRLDAKGPKGLIGDAAGAKRLLQAAMPQRAEELSKDLDLASPALTETLAGLVPEDLARFLEKEHPQTIALTLAHLDAKPAGLVLKLLPQQLHVEAIQRIARLEAVDPQVLGDLEEAIRDGIGKNRVSASQRKGGAEQVAAMLSGLDEKTREMQLGQLEERDPDLAEAVRSLLFVFRDIAGLDDRGIQEILKTVAEATLKLALKTAEPALSERFFKNMSSRRAETLKDDLAAMPKVKVAEVEGAQKDMATLARKLMEEGKITDPKAAA